MPRWRPSWLKLVMVKTTLYEAEFKFFQESYSEDIDTGQLGIPILFGSSTLEVMLKEEKISCFDEILLAMSKFPEPEKKEANTGSPNCL